MPEGVMPYPRFEGQLTAGNNWRVVASNEIREALRSTWGLFTVLAGLGWGMASVIEIAQGASSFDDTILQSAMEDMLGQLRWFALAVAAAVAAPSLLRDAREGALELYLSRSLTRGGYLMGKAAATVILISATMILPLILFYVSGLSFYDAFPENWHRNVGLAFIYALQWSLLISGVALGLSCVARSARGSVLFFLALFAGTDLVVSNLLSNLTENSDFAVISPLAAHEQQMTWWFQAEPLHSFPTLWGALAWGGLTILGWVLFVWRAPRVRGDDNA